MKKKIVAIIIAISMVGLTACGSSAPAAGDPAPAGTDAGTDDEPGFLSDLNSVKPDAQTGWIDSDISGYYTQYPDIDLKNDFAAAVNMELYRTTGFEGTALGNIGREVTVRKRELLNDSSVSGDGIDEVRKYVSLIEDTDTRNRLGVEPLRPYIEGIEQISTVSGLYDWITDTRSNPLGIAPIAVAGMARSEIEPDSYFVALSKPVLTLGSDDAYYSVGSGALERMVKVEEQSERILSGLGYSDSQIDDIIRNNYRFEKVLTGLERDLRDEDEEDMTFTREEIEYIQGDYPMTEYLDNWGYGGCQRFVADSEYIRKLDNVCERYLEQIKDMCIVRYVMSSGMYLDEETAGLFMENKKERGVTPVPDGRSDEEKYEDLIFETYLMPTALQGALDAAYVDKYIDPESYDRLYGMTEDIIGQFREIFAAESWLSDEGRRACLDKLNAIRIHVVYQDEGDYGDMNIRTAGEGGNFLEAFYEINRFGIMARARMSAGKVDRTQWSPYMYELSTTQTNAFYHPQTNGIYIMAGILDDPAFRADMTEEELLSGIGVIVGHEITHGFDALGVAYDKDGVKKKWLPEDDQKSFEDATAKVSLYYLTLKPYNGSGPYNGTNIQGEATADMGGMRAALDLARKIPGFDYDAFFRNYARLWATQRTLDEERAYMSQDSHPLNMYRINVVVSQFDEFQQTYGIQAGDGMYADPDKRIAVW